MKREETTMLLLYNLYKDGSGIVVAVFTDFAFISCSFFVVLRFSATLCVLFGIIGGKQFVVFMSI